MNQASDLNQSFLHLTTRGRKTGKQHTIELWFAAADHSLYFLAHKDSQWWKNIRASPNVTVQVGGNALQGRGRIVDERRQEVFRMFEEKYGKSQVNQWYGHTRNERKVVEVIVQKT